MFDYREIFPYFESVSLPNLYVLKLLQRFPKVLILRMHSKVTTAELARFLDITKNSLQEFQQEESIVDFTKLFRNLTLSTLRKLKFTNTKKLIEDVDIRALVVATPNLVSLDLSGIPSMTNSLVEMVCKGLPKIEEFILLRNTKVTNDVFVFFGKFLPKL